MSEFLRIWENPGGGDQSLVPPSSSAGPGLAQQLLRFWVVSGTVQGAGGEAMTQRASCCLCGICVLVKARRAWNSVPMGSTGPFGGCQGGGWAALDWHCLTCLGLYSPPSPPLQLRAKIAFFSKQTNKKTQCFLEKWDCWRWCLTLDGRHRHFGVS